MWPQCTIEGMDTELLRTFLEVKSTRHFGRAAENLFITQAAVSARIKQLEAYFGASLFLRDRHNIQLTPEGERLVPYAESILMSLLRARQDFALRDGGDLRLRLGIRHGLWGDLLQDRLDLLHEQVGELKLQVESLTHDMIVKKLRDRALDAALVFDAPTAPELSAATVGEMRLRLFAHESVSTLADAVVSRYVYMEWGGPFARFHMRHVVKEPLPSFHTNVVEAAISEIKRRKGAGYLPACLAEKLASERIFEVSDAPMLNAPLVLLTPSQAKATPLIKALGQTLADVQL